jgi:serine/threonine protein phosphatase PrpC
VWLKNAPLPGLNMSRSLGDLIAKQAGVISQPHKAVHAISASDRALVLASDGLWDFVANEETASVALSTGDTWEAAARLARLARSRWLTRTYGADDTTVVIVRFGNIGTTTGGGGGGAGLSSGSVASISAGVSSGHAMPSSP